MNNRVASRRPPLARGLVQLASIFLALARAEGIKTIGADGKGIALAPIAIPPEDDDGETVYELPRLGSGKAIEVIWGELHSPTPNDLQLLSQASTIATGGQPVVSQRTGVGLFAALGQTGVDTEDELERIEHERENRVASFESSMTPDADDELDDAIDGADVDKSPASGAPAQGAAADVQKQALNGAQQQALVSTLAATGITLSAESALFALQSSFPDLDVDGAKSAIATQIEFAKTLGAAAPEPKPVPNFKPPENADA